MMLGHALVAFALVAAVASARVGSRRALWLGVVAGLFATAPDVDMVFALPGLVEGVTRLAASPGDLGTGDVFTVTGSFWAASTAVHRSVTHSVVVGLFAAVGAGLLAPVDATVSRRGLGAAVLSGPVLLAALVSGPAAATMVGATVFVVAGVALRSARRLSLSGRSVGLLAAAGLGSHPFGDLFTGRPPALLYPLPVEPLGSRVVLAGDPTLHLLAVFALEVLAAWAAVAVALRLTGRSPARHVRPVALAATGYGLVGVVLPAPTLETSYQFVFTVLAVGLASAGLALRTDRRTDGDRPDPADGTRPTARAGAGARVRSDGGGATPLRPPGTLDRDRVATAAVTGVAAVTLAWSAYLVVYVGGLAPT